MKFGYGQNVHDISKSQDYSELLDQVREIAVHCDETGFDYLWFPEHHFSIWGREMMPNPLMAAADIAARTKSVRVGLAAAIIGFWHPIRLAEDLAMLDQLSKGRLDIGVGRGNYGLEAMNLNPIADPNDQDSNRRVFEETVEILRKALGQRLFSHKGEFYQFPAPGFKADRAHTVDDPEFVDAETGELAKLTIIPGAKQRPLPPMWQVVSASPQSIRFAASNNMGIIMWRATIGLLKRNLGIYKEAHDEALGTDIPFGQNTAIARDTYVAETDAEARDFAGEALMGALNFSNWRGPGVYLDPDETLDPDLEAALTKELTFDFVNDRCLLFGSPDTVLEKLKELHTETGIGLVNFKCGWPGLAHDAEMRSLKLLSEEVLPRFREWEAQQSNRKSAAS